MGGVLGNGMVTVRKASVEWRTVCCLIMISI